MIRSSPARQPARVRPRRGAVLGALALLALLAAAFPLLTAQGQEARQPTGIRVSGQGSVSVAPDIATINLGASVLRDRPDAAFERTEQLVTAATQVFRAAGVRDADIRTTQLSLYQEFRPRPPNFVEQDFLGWRARHSFSVQLRDFTVIGRLVAEAVAALEDSGEVGGIFFGVENPNPLIERARDAAAGDARQKAERIAARLGVRLGPAVYVEEFGSPQPTPVRAPTALPPPPVPAPVRPVTPAQISAGEQTISVTLFVHFAIEGVPLTGDQQEALD